MRAVEFFSGLGAFSESARGNGVEVVAAFDQNSHANRVFFENFSMKPSSLNLESINADMIPESSLWWMSPPCQPYTRRGNRRDSRDPRARSLLNLIDLIPSCLPAQLIVENVEGFELGEVFAGLSETLSACGYESRLERICSTDFGVPMLRPRVFLLASRSGPISPLEPHRFHDRRRLVDYLVDDADVSLVLAPEILDRFYPVLNIVDPTEEESSRLICFTRGYYKCRKASGSLIRLPDGRVRFVSPGEILALLGFSGEYAFPEDLSLSLRYRLAGNSVDVRAVSMLLASLGISLNEG
ncbi:MAG: DNA cytosine methyltransferase [Cyanobacteria bacterium HKST-UBA02]|nr:DNA cytosine methyltransferase [Cyanobacteria bacterium HKST-UBA02]